MEKKTKTRGAASYDAPKEHEGRRYTGMKVGRSHRWYYDQGQWTETKVTPDLWTIEYTVTKRRKGKAPEGSGVPVGTAYHWYILAHQHVEKLNANDYSTSLEGLKFKIAHKRADSEKWSTTERGQRKRMIEFLRGVIADLEAEQEEGAGAFGKAAAKEAARRPPAGPATPPSLRKPTRRRKTKARATRKR